MASSVHISKPILRGQSVAGNHCCVPRARGLNGIGGDCLGHPTAEG